MHDRAISLRVVVCGNKTSLTPPLFIEVSVPSQESEWSYICVLRVSILPLSTIVLLGCGTVPTAVFFVLFLVLSKLSDDHDYGCIICPQ